MIPDFQLHVRLLYFEGPSRSNLSNKRDCVTSNGASDQSYMQLPKSDNREHFGLRAHFQNRVQINANLCVVQIQK